jgi:hypothetical protein
MAIGGTTEPLYHRLESPTQPSGIVVLQQQSGRIRGYPARGSLIPKVKAYSGPLAQDRRGIEFTTDVPPDLGGAPGYVTWSGIRPGIVHGVDEHNNSFVEIRVVITRNTQMSSR